MELYLFHPEQQRQLYGCINVTVGYVTLEERQHVTEGVIVIVLAVLYYILYIPCIPSIYRYIKYPCYKLLFYISIVDCSVLWLIGIVHGYFAIAGVVFCSYPRLIYLFGCHIWITWICETSGQLCLVINRCVAILSLELENKIFGGKRIYAWLSCSMAWGIYWFFKIRPLLFNGIYFSWFFDPYLGYSQTASENTYNTSFSNTMHKIWDAVFAISIPCLYIVFAIIFFAKSNNLKNNKRISKPQKMMLLQVTSISILNVGCVSTYLYMTYFVPGKLFMHFAQYSYLHMHGFPPVIYLLFNSTIRKDAKKC